MPIHLITLLAAAIIVTALVAFVATKEKPTQSLAAALILGALWLGAAPYVATINQYHTPLVANLVTGAVAVLALITAIRTGKPVPATLLITCGALLAGMAYGVVA